MVLTLHMSRKDMRTHRSVTRKNQFEIGAVLLALVACAANAIDDEEDEPPRPGDDGKNDSAETDSGGAGTPVPTKRATIIANAIVREDSPTQPVATTTGLQTQGSPKARTL